MVKDRKLSWRTACKLDVCNTDAPWVGVTGLQIGHQQAVIEQTINQDGPYIIITNKVHMSSDRTPDAKLITHTDNGEQFVGLPAFTVISLGREWYRGWRSKTEQQEITVMPDTCIMMIDIPKIVSWNKCDIDELQFQTGADITMCGKREHIFGTDTQKPIPVAIIKHPTQLVIEMIQEIVTIS